MRSFFVASAKINHQLCWWNKKSLDTRKPPFAKLSAGLPTAFRAKVVSRFGPVDKVAQEASMWYNKHEEG